MGIKLGEEENGSKKDPKGKNRQLLNKCRDPSTLGNSTLVNMETLNVETRHT